MREEKKRIYGWGGRKGLNEREKKEYEVEEKDNPKFGRKKEDI